MSEPAFDRSEQSVLFNYILPLPILFLAFAIPTYLYLAKPKAPEAENIDLAPIVQTEAIEAAPSSFAISTHGTVVPKTEVTVAAEVSGKIIKTAPSCEAGVFVKAGTPLVEIDPSKYELQVQQLESELKQAEIDLLEQDIEKDKNESLVAIAEENLAIAQRELDRFEQLLRRESASLSQRDQQSSQVMQMKNALQQLVSQRGLLEQKKERLGAQRDLTQTRLAMAKLDLERTKIVAPIDGFITEDLVEESAYAQPGMALFKIEDRSAIEIRCNLKIDDLYWLTGSNSNDGKGEDVATVLYRAPHVPAKITYKVAGQSYSWDNCFLSRYEGTGLDEKTRTIPCRIEVPHPDEKRIAGDFPTLVRGMFVEVDLTASPHERLMQIPYSALRPNDEVWVIRGNELRILRVRVAKMLEKTVLIYADGLDLRPGEDIVTSPLSVAIDGMKIRRLDQPETRAIVNEPTSTIPPATKTEHAGTQTPVEPTKSASNIKAETSG